MAIEAGGGGLPGNAVALSYAEGTRVDPAHPDVVIGTVDMISAASMFGSGVLKALQDTTVEAPVEAEFTLVDGVIDSWSISGQDMAAALERRMRWAKVAATCWRPSRRMRSRLSTPSWALPTSPSAHQVARWK
jgi:hypothetical protein